MGRHQIRILLLTGFGAGNDSRRRLKRRYRNRGGRENAWRVPVIRTLGLDERRCHRFAACRERAKGPGRASVELGKADSTHGGRFFALSHRRQLRQRRCEGGGTAKRRARRSRGRQTVSARVAASREGRAGRPRVRRAPEAPAARRFPVPGTACAQDARSHGRMAVGRERRSKSAIGDSAVRLSRGWGKAGRVKVQ